MGDGTKIEWTDATWNPITGCSVVSPGCTNCYAMKLAGTRLKHTPSRRGLTTDSKAGPVWNGEVRFNREWLDQPLRWAAPRRIFVCAHGDLFHENVPDDWIDQVFAVMALAPRHTFQALTKRPDRMRDYVNGKWQNGGPTSRMQHIDSACVEHLDRFRLADPSRTDHWTRDGKCLAMQWAWPLPNVWLGVSVEDQVRADERIPHLLAVPAAKRFLSIEPLLGPVDLGQWIEPIDHCGACGAENPPQEPDVCPECGAHNMLISTWGWAEAERYRTGERWALDSEAGHADVYGTAPHIDWVIVGGKSGSGDQPLHPDWVRSLRDQCTKAGTPFFFKQWGEWSPYETQIGAHEPYALANDGTLYRAADIVYPDGPRRGEAIRANHDRANLTMMYRIGKKRAGAMLDGREWREMPT